MEENNNYNSNNKKSLKKTCATLILVALLGIAGTRLIDNSTNLIMDLKRDAEYAKIDEIKASAQEESITKKNISKITYPNNPAKLPIPSDVSTFTSDVKPLYFSNNEIVFSVYINGNYETLKLNLEKFNLPKNIYTYNQNLIFRLTYSRDTFEVFECEIFDAASNELINPTEANIEKLYNIDYKETTQAREWTSEIKLSKLTENQIYEYIAPQDGTISPKVINDLPVNCIVYLKDPNSNIDDYTKLVYMGNSQRYADVYHFITSTPLKANQVLKIMYKKANAKEILNIVPKNSVIFVSELGFGDEIQNKNTAKYIYNDTKYPLILTTKDYYNSDEKRTFLNAEEIYEFDFTVDSAVVDVP